MKIQLVRHATLRININGKTILVDPLLSSRGKMLPVPNVANKNYNPTVELPMEAETAAKADALLLTHTHRDHFDETAISILAKDMPVFCQPEDVLKVEEKGFHCINGIERDYIWEDITINRTRGQHGKGEIAKQMGPVSGYIISVKGEQSLYITGDTVWCPEVEEALETYKPELIICFAGSARMTEDGIPITMTKEDVLKVCNKMPKSKIIVVHMESWNHCMLTRNELRNFLSNNNILDQVLIPNDGDIIELAK